jgi:hypothetical protein
MTGDAPALAAPRLRAASGRLETSMRIEILYCAL